MPNIMLTNYCNRKCPYCFALAQVAVGTCEPHWEISQRELEIVLGYLSVPGDMVSLLGGEPTLHSRFADIVAEVAARHFKMKIFTNGTTPHLRNIPSEARGEDMRIILNLNAPATYPPEQWDEIERNCRHFSEHISLSFNIDRPDFSWEYLRSVICDWGISRIIRVGLTQPIHGAANHCLSDADLPAACSRLVVMAEDLAKEGITLGLDCGFQQCSFTVEQRGILVQCGTQMLFDCKPILDIGPGLMVWRCFPFSATRGVTLTDFQSLHQIADHFDREWHAQREADGTLRCAKCEAFASASCKGGCLARAVNRMRRSSKTQ